MGCEWRPKLLSEERSLESDFEPGDISCGKGCFHQHAAPENTTAPAERSHELKRYRI